MPAALSALAVVALVLAAYGVGRLAGRSAGTRDGWLTGYREGLRHGEQSGREAGSAAGFREALAILPPAPVRNRLAARARWS